MALIDWQPASMAPARRTAASDPLLRIKAAALYVDAAERLLGEDQRVDPEVLAGLERARGELERQRGEAATHRQTARELEHEARGELAEAKALRSAVEHEAEQAEEQRVQALVEGL